MSNPGSDASGRPKDPAATDLVDGVIDRCRAVPSLPDLPAEGTPVELGRLAKLAGGDLDVADLAGPVCRWSRRADSVLPRGRFEHVQKRIDYGDGHLALEGSIQQRAAEATGASAPTTSSGLVSSRRPRALDDNHTFEMGVRAPPLGRHQVSRAVHTSLATLLSRNEGRSIARIGRRVLLSSRRRTGLRFARRSEGPTCRRLGRKALEEARERSASEPRGEATSPPAHHLRL